MFLIAALIGVSKDYLENISLIDVSKNYLENISLVAVKH